MRVPHLALVAGALLVSAASRVAAQNPGDACDFESVRCTGPTVIACTGLPGKWEIIERCRYGCKWDMPGHCAFGPEDADPNSPGGPSTPAPTRAVPNPPVPSPVAPNPPTQNPTTPDPPAQNPTTPNPPAQNPTTPNSPAQNPAAPNSPAPSPGAPVAPSPAAPISAPGSPTTPNAAGGTTGAPIAAVTSGPLGQGSGAVVTPGVAAAGSAGNLGPTAVGGSSAATSTGIPTDKFINGVKDTISKTMIIVIVAVVVGLSLLICAVSAVLIRNRRRRKNLKLQQNEFRSNEETNMQFVTNNHSTAALMTGSTHFYNPSGSSIAGSHDHGSIPSPQPACLNYGGTQYHQAQGLSAATSAPSVASDGQSSQVYDGSQYHQAQAASSSQSAWRTPTTMSSGSEHEELASMSRAPPSYANATGNTVYETRPASSASAGFAVASAASSSQGYASASVEKARLRAHHETAAQTAPQSSSSTKGSQYHHAALQTAGTPGTPSDMRAAVVNVPSSAPSTGSNDYFSDPALLNPTKMFVCTHPHRPRSPEEVEAAIGDSLFMVRMFRDGWVYVRNLTRNTEGMMPGAYLGSAGAAAEQPAAFA
ncbi:uncharacterized protein EV422DRAFT_402360 [Fimicolochytrium jonesii]|uniref:uncharacterized protein n=1 Tax=Fimicolochytrium jonesii TaxID=1396493 RepID=UPI0022FF04A8|nr:uncharacterized protein EV422DRAFT_402360 [Fimicolochytrium jonesii]KAI8822528.1 hypothetical protein EV422DRAFT_402360 [Fimicolochytrium jonesii]